MCKDYEIVQKLYASFQNWSFYNVEFRFVAAGGAKWGDLLGALQEAHSMKRPVLAPPTNPPSATTSSSIHVPNNFCVRFHKFFTCNGDTSCKKKDFCFLCHNPHRALLCPSLKAPTLVTAQSFPVQPIIRSYSPSQYKFVRGAAQYGTALRYM